jgi:hypothetical protein
MRAIWPVRYEMTRGLICSIRAARSDSAAVIAFAVSFAVLLFEPHATMPPRNEATEAAMSPRSDRIAPTSIAAKTSPPPAAAIREARLKLGGKLFNVLLEADDLLVGIRIS